MSRFKKAVTSQAEEPAPFQGASLPHEPPEIAEQDLQALRQMSLAERGRQLAIACRSAARLDRSRRKAGLPAPVREPWPESTWEFLKQQAARHARR